MGMILAWLAMFLAAVARLRCLYSAQCGCFAS